MLLEQIVGHAQDHAASVAIVDDKRTVTYRELALGGEHHGGAC